MDASLAPSIVLYAAPMSSAIPVVQAMAELEVPHELIMLDLAEGHQRRPGFLALNPNGRVPTVVVDGTPMFEALAIMQWLGDRFGVERGLWPASDAPQRLEALSWSTWTYVTYASAFQRLLHASAEHMPAERHNPAQAEHAAAELQMLLGLLDARLASRSYMLGDAFTLVDVIVGCGVGYATFFGARADGHPHVMSWLDRLRARDSYKRSMPDLGA